MPEAKASVSPEHCGIRGTGVWVSACMVTSPSLAFFLTQELEDRREVLVSIATGAHDSEDLVGKGTQRDGRLCVGGSVLSQTKILETEP